MKMDMIPISECIPYHKNPRKNDKAVDIVAKSIMEFGFQNPIILDNENIIIAGHTRLKAAQKLGLKEVPVIWAGPLTSEQAKAYRIMDNKSGEYADWEIDALKLELEELDEMAFDTELTGFTHEEIGNILDQKDTINVEKVDKLGSLTVTCPKCKHQFKRKDNLLTE